MNRAEKVDPKIGKKVDPKKKKFTPYLVLIGKMNRVEKVDPKMEKK